MRILQILVKMLLELEEEDGFLLVRFLAPNFILGRGGRDGGEEVDGFFFVDLRAVFLVDFLVVFLAGMVWLLLRFWGKRGGC